jgi:hypothetical protein
MKLVAAVLVSLAVAVPAAADDPSDANPAPDFLFHTPRATLGVRVTWLQPRAGSDLFSFVNEHLTIERRDFARPAVIAEGGLVLSPRIALVGGVEFSRRHVPSEYRHFVEDTREPIVQQTYFDLMNASAGLKVSLLPNGRAVSRLAWVPRGFVPFVAAGAGGSWYRFRQTGDFVDFADLDIFTDVFTSEGWAPSTYVSGGADVRMWRAVSLAVEARYVWSHADLGGNFVGFDPIDLSGLRMSTGFSLLF